MKAGDFVTIKNSETQKIILSELSGCRYPKETTEKMISIFQEFKTEKTINLSRRFFDEKEIFEVKLDYPDDSRRWFSVFRVVRVGNVSHSSALERFMSDFDQAAPTEKEALLETGELEDDPRPSEQRTSKLAPSLGTYKTLMTSKTKTVDAHDQAPNQKKPSGKSKINIAANKVLNKIRKTHRFLNLMKRSSIEPLRKGSQEQTESAPSEHSQHVKAEAKRLKSLDTDTRPPPTRQPVSPDKRSPEKDARKRGDRQLLRQGDVVVFQHLVSGNFLKERETFNGSLALVNQSELTRLVFFRIEKLFDPGDTSELIREKCNIKLLNWESGNCVSLLEEGPTRTSNLRLFSEKFSGEGLGEAPEASLAITRNLRGGGVGHRLEMLPDDFSLKVNRFFLEQVESEFLRPLVVMHDFRRTSIHCYNSFFQWGMTLKRAHNEGGPSSENVFDKQTALFGHHQILETQRRFETSLRAFSDLITNIHDFSQFSPDEAAPRAENDTDRRESAFMARLNSNQDLLGFFDFHFERDPRRGAEEKVREAPQRGPERGGLSIFGDSDVVLRNKTFMQRMMRKNGVIEVLVGFLRLFCQKIYKSIDFESIYGAEREQLRSLFSNYPASARLQRYFFCKKEFSWDSLKYTPQKMGFEIFGNIFRELLSIVNFFIRWADQLQRGLERVDPGVRGGHLLPGFLLQRRVRAPAAELPQELGGLGRGGAARVDGENRDRRREQGQPAQADLLPDRHQEDLLQPQRQHGPRPALGAQDQDAQPPLQHQLELGLPRRHQVLLQQGGKRLLRGLLQAGRRYA